MVQCVKRSVKLRREALSPTGVALGHGEFLWTLCDVSLGRFMLFRSRCRISRFEVIEDCMRKGMAVCVCGWWVAGGLEIEHPG